MTAITAITAQNTLGVTRVEAVSPEMIIEQVRAVSLAHPFDRDLQDFEAHLR